MTSVFEEGTPSQVEDSSRTVTRPDDRGGPEGAGGVPVRTRRRPDAATVAVVGLAAVTCGWNLGGQPLWYDELASEHAAALSWPALRRLLALTDANVGAYYAFLHVWRGLGDGAFTLRLPEAVAGVVTVWLVVLAGRRLLGRAPGLLAGLLLAVHPFATAYARDVRSYAFAAMWSTAALVLGLRARDRASAGRLALYAASSTLAVVSHMYAALYVGALALALVPSDRTARLRWLAAQVPAGATAAGLLYVSFDQRGQLNWVPPLTPAHAVGGATLLAGGPLALAAVVVALGVLVVRSPRDLATRVLVALVVLPFVALVLAGLVFPTFVPRYLDTTVPAQCLALAAAWSSFSGGLRWRVPVGAVVVGSLVLGTVASVSAPYHYEDYRSASRELLAAARPGDGAVYADGTLRLGMKYYLPRVAAPGASIPVDVIADPRQVQVVFRAPILRGAAAEAAMRRFRRLWLVQYDRPGPVLTAPSGYDCATPVNRFALRITLCTRTP